MYEERAKGPMQAVFFIFLDHLHLTMTTLMSFQAVPIPVSDEDKGL